LAASSKRLRVAQALLCAVRQNCAWCPTTPSWQGLPPWHQDGLGVSRFARRYYGDTVCSSGYVRCFSWPGALRTSAVLTKGERVAPLGDRGIKACWPLPHAFRRGATSVVGTHHRGIRRLPLLSCRGYGLCSPRRTRRHRASAARVVDILNLSQNLYLVRFAGGLRHPHPTIQERNQTGILLRCLGTAVSLERR
jgi:hypothetical protein